MSYLWDIYWDWPWKYWTKSGNGPKLFYLFIFFGRGGGREGVMYFGFRYRFRGMVSIGSRVRGLVFEVHLGLELGFALGPVPNLIWKYIQLYFYEILSWYCTRLTNHTWLFIIILSLIMIHNQTWLYRHFTEEHSVEYSVRSLKLVLYWPNKWMPTPQS